MSEKILSFLIVSILLVFVRGGGKHPPSTKQKSKDIIYIGKIDNVDYYTSGVYDTRYGVLTYNEAVQYCNRHKMVIATIKSQENGMHVCDHLYSVVHDHPQWIAKSTTPSKKACTKIRCIPKHPGYAAVFEYTKCSSSYFGSALCQAP